MKNNRKRNTITRKSSLHDKRQVKRSQHGLSGLIATELLHFIRNDAIPLLLLVIFLIPGILGLLHVGFPSTDDGGWMIIRFSAFYEALRHGQVPVRFLMRLNNGYGYPVADFLYPLFLYLGVPIHIVGINFINTIKIILGSSLLFSGLCTYLWTRRLFDRLASFVAAVAYTFFPYHLYDVYQRGSVGEVLALAIVPFIFWQIERKSLFWTSLGIGFLILSHNTLALLFLPVIIIYMLIKKFSSLQRTRQAHSSWLTPNGIVFIDGLAITSVFLGLGLSAFFWLPALYDKQFTIFDSVSVSDFSQYFLQTKNFGLLGIFGLMIALVGINFAFKRGKKHDIFFLGVLYVGLFFSLPVSSFIWRVLPLPELVQFPFRFLSLVILGVAFMTAFMLAHMKSSLRVFVAVLSIFLVYITSWQYLFPTTYTNYPDSYYATNQDSTTVKNEYMPKWVKIIPSSSTPEKVQLISGQGSVNNLATNGANRILFTLALSKQTTIAINTIYFPGWQVFANNKLQQFSYNNSHGVMLFSLPAGNYTIKAVFGETRIRLWADFISLLSILILLITIPSIKKLLYEYIAKWLTRNKVTI